MTAKETDSRQITQEKFFKKEYGVEHLGTVLNMIGRGDLTLTEVLEGYANFKALHIAEQAVGVEKSDWDHEREIVYACDSILSRIKTLIEE